MTAELESVPNKDDKTESCLFPVDRIENRIDVMVKKEIKDSKKMFVGCGNDDIDMVWLLEL